MKKQGKYEKRAKDFLLKTFLTSQLCLMLCVTMFLGTTYAWFTSEIVSEGNEINIGILDVDLYKQTGEGKKDLSDPANKLFDSSARWEPGYTALETVTVENKGNLSFRYELTFTNGKVDGVENPAALAEIAKLFTVYVHAGDYAAGEEKPTSIADIQKIAEDEVTPETEKTWRVVRLGNKPATLADILERGLPVFSGNMEVEGSKDTYIIALHMIGNDEITDSAQQAALNAAMGKTISLDVKLNAYQRSHEQDAFGSAYDLKAHVTNLGALDIEYTGGQPLTLDAAYQFQPVESWEEAKEAPYKNYVADFAVWADRDIPMNSITLAGYYSLFCDGWNDGKWVAMMIDDPGKFTTEDVNEKTPIRLVKDLYYPVTYELLCQFGNDGVGFLCGLAEREENGGVEAGTTITVELRLYEVVETSPNNFEENGDYIVAGSYQYTFE